MPPIIMRRGRIDLSTRTPLSIARLSASAPSSHDLSLAAFTISMAESSFRYTQVAGEHLQDLIPRRSFPARRQPIGPESIKLKLLPQLPGQPAGAPLPRATQLHLGKAKLNNRRIARDRFAAIRREQRQRPGTAGILVEHLDRLAPCDRLRGVDLAEIQNVPLHHPPVTKALVLDHVPVVVRLAVLLSLGASQKHDATNLCETNQAWESGRSSLQPFLIEIEDPARCKSNT